MTPRPCDRDHVIVVILTMTTTKSDTRSALSWISFQSSSWQSKVTTAMVLVKCDAVEVTVNVKSLLRKVALGRHWDVRRSAKMVTPIFLHARGSLTKRGSQIKQRHKKKQSSVKKDTLGDRLISRFGPVNWPPRSCDLTPLDYFLWGYVKSLVYGDKPQTLDHLEDNIRRVIADIRPQMLEKVIENWTSRLDYIRASRGSPMPEIIFKM
ncbi:uncharacterized protein TNCV_1808891 [Trichonephila clavipes]|nr:uncharacterized protein TNCV_1808891 [Trichonephila clavipes]